MKHMVKIDFDNKQVLPLEQALDNAFIKNLAMDGYDPVTFNYQRYLDSLQSPWLGGWWRLENRPSATVHVLKRKST